MDFEDVKTIINQESLISKPKVINQKVNSVEQNNIGENNSDKEHIKENSINLSEIITLKEIEYKAIIAGLNRTNWNLTLTAEQLGISRMTLYRKLEQHDLRKKEQ